MRLSSDPSANSHFGLHFFADTPNILHLRYVLERYPDVPIILFYNEIMTNFDRLITDASEFAYFMANFPNYTAQISLRLCDGATFTRLISCDPANLLLIARLRPSIAEDLLICFRGSFPSVCVSKEIVDEISRLNLEANVFIHRRHRMFALRAPCDISCISESVGVPVVNSYFDSLSKFKFSL